MRLPTTNCTLRRRRTSTGEGTVHVGGEKVGLLRAELSLATEGYAPFEIIPSDARAVAVGRHDFLPISAIAWLSARNEIVVTVQGTIPEAGRELLVRVWSGRSGIMCRAAELQPRNGHTVAEVNVGTWNGLPIAGVTLISLIRVGEEW